MVDCEETAPIHLIWESFTKLRSSVAVVGVVRIYFLDHAVVSGDFYCKLGYPSSSPLHSILEAWPRLIVTGDGSLSFMWSSIEVNVGIICGSVPMLRPLVVIIIPGFLGTSQHESFESRTRDLGVNEESYGSGARDLSGNVIGYESGTPALNTHGPGCESGTGGLNTGNHTRSTQGALNVSNLYTSHSEPAISPVDVSMRHVWRPLLLVTVLFFFWGFAYGLIGVLRSKFQVLYNLTTSQALGLQGAYFTCVALISQMIQYH